MTLITIKGREYRAPTIRDSFDRRAQQAANTIAARLQKLGLTENDIELEVERVAMRRVPANVTWYMGGHRLHYSCATQTSHAANMALVAQVIDREVQAVLDGELSFEDFVSRFIEHDEDLTAVRAEARKTLGVDAGENDFTVIDRAYKTLAKEHHPDRHGGDDTEFKRINNAHKTLKRELA